MLPSSPHVRQVYLDSRGIVPTLRSLTPVDTSDTLCIDSTTLDVQVGRDVAAEVHSVGAEMVDAPVSGGMLTLRVTYITMFCVFMVLSRCDRR